MRILACVAAASALQAPAQRRPATKLQALGVVEGLGALAVGGGLAVLLSEDNRDIDDKTEVERYFNGEEGFGPPPVSSTDLSSPALAAGAAFLAAATAA